MLSSRLMRRFEAFVLLCALLTVPVSLLAAVVIPAAQLCCDGEMCPMHRNQRALLRLAGGHDGEQGLKSPHRGK